jgi:hypothetical protein
MKTSTINTICTGLIILLLGVLAGLHAQTESLLCPAILTSTFEGGIIPGHEVSLYEIPDEQQELNVKRSFYTDMQIKLDFGKLLYVSGGMTAYEWGMKKISASYYPFRMDFLFGTGIHWGALTLGYAHGCFHPVMPNVAIAYQGKIDAGQDRIFVKAEISNKLF